MVLLLGEMEEKRVKARGTKQNKHWEPLDVCAGAACLAPADFFPQPTHYVLLRLST